MEQSITSGVGESDKMLYSYLDERRIVKYWKKVAFDIMNRMILNAYIIYKGRVGNRAMTRLDFISKIIFDIECEWMKEKNAQVFLKCLSKGKYIWFSKVATT